MRQIPACPDVPALMPCPFCGVTPDVDDPATFQRDEGGKWGFVVCCCNGPDVRTSYLPVEHWRADAIEAWNTRALPSTALAARPEGGGWQIKPLEWDALHGFSGRARTPFGWVTILDLDNDGYELKMPWHARDDLYFKDIDTARAAAQADYEARIRSALVAPSTPPTAGDGHD